MRGIQDGILVTTMLFSEDKERAIVTRERKKFNKNEKGLYRDKFDTLQNQSKIINCNIEDNVWTLREEFDGYENKINVKFPFEIRPTINESLKFYCIDRFTNKISPQNIKIELGNITRTLTESNNFNAENVEDFEDYIYSLSDTIQMKLRDNLFSYLSYIQEDIPIDYKNILGKILNADRHSRILPDYRSILYFDYFMKKFISEAPNSMREKFYPIILWWVITTCIPMRPTEFSRLKKRGCFKENGICYLKFTRAKPHSFIEKALDKRKTQVLKITEDVYNIIMEYINFKMDDNKYLLSYDLFKQDFAKNAVRANYELIPTFNLRNILDEFYEKVIDGMYGFSCISKEEVSDSQTRIIGKITGNNIVKLQLGDTRHLAIMNLVLQGLNPYTIMELAGHKDINSQCNYAYHIEKYVESKTIVLADDIRKKLLDLEFGNLPPEQGNRRAEKSSELLVKDLSNEQDILKLHGGYCKRYLDKMNEFPNLCFTSCKKCNEFIRNTDELTDEELEAELRELQNEIDARIKIIQFYTSESLKNRLIIKETGKFNAISQSNLKTSANILESLIKEKATIQAQCLKHKEIKISELENIYTYGKNEK